MIKINFDTLEKFSQEWQERISEVFGYGLSLLGQSEKFEINLSFVEDEEIQRLNSDYRQVDKKTDVLSFPAHDFVLGETVDCSLAEYALNVNPETGRFMLGDIVICPEVASLQAEELGHSFEQEVARLAVHSFLHCFGYDHIDDADYEIMRKMEEEIIANFDYLTE